MFIDLKPPVKKEVPDPASGLTTFIDYLSPDIKKKGLLKHSDSVMSKIYLS